ncbi:SPW repeat domain-containing protein [Nocardia niwae]|uniref:SPW repeat domain-containing protein n=1 Tax=Nocardia niwae TaxID=626084 RepID=UPI000AFDD6CE|nr:SPW repeat protein [Nocardia niwae]
MARSTWVGWAALVVGIGAVAASITVSSTRVGEGLTFGFGAFIAFFGVLSLPVRNRTPDHWGLFVVGLAMFLLPWLGAGFVPDRGAAWTAWVAGFLAMALGAAAWTLGNPPTASGIRDYSTGAAERSALSYWISRAALVVGVVTVVLAGAVVHSSAVATAVMIGLGGLTAVTALWSLLAGDPTRDYLALAVVGFALFLAPWVGGFTGGSAAWTAWISGCLVTLLGGTGYLRDESLDISGTAAATAEARYRERFR